VGDLLFTDEDQAHSQGEEAPSAVHTVVFAVGNGLRASTRVRFQGVSADNAVLLDGANEQTFTCYVGGTVTVVNSGDRHFNLGDYVAWVHPLHIMDPNGIKRPKVCVRSEPGDKFLFGLVPMSELNVFTQFEEIAQNVMDYLKKHHPGAIHEDSKAAGAIDGMLKNVRALIKPHSFMPDVEGHLSVAVYDPARLYALVTALSMTTESFRQNGAAKYWQEFQNKDANRHIAWDQTLNGNNRSLSINTVSRRNNANKRPVTSRFDAKHIGLIRIATKLQAEQNALVRSRIIGRCDRRCAPGEQLDVLLQAM
jgi:hypothetical protein